MLFLTQNRFFVKNQLNLGGNFNKKRVSLKSDTLRKGEPLYYFVAIEF